MFFVVHVVHWHLPYRIAGVVDELPLLGVALGAGLMAGSILPRVAGVFARFGAWPTAAFVALIVFLQVQAADPFVRQRSWLYAPERCDHVVEFPRRPSILSGEAVNDQKRSEVERARHIDLGQATTFSAECLDFGGEIGAGDRARLIEAAEAQLKRAAALLRLKVERTTRGDGTVTLAGFSDEGRNAYNLPLVRRAEARAVLGRSSLLVLWAWSVGGEGAQFPPNVAVFFDSVRPASAR